MALVVEGPRPANVQWSPCPGVDNYTFWAVLPKCVEGHLYSRFLLASLMPHADVLSLPYCRMCGKRSKLLTTLTTDDKA